MKAIESVPHALRTFEALRSLGYTLNSSIADIVDNSLAEGVAANKIKIDFSFNRKDEITCRISDDGKGMSAAQLEEAMRLGAESSYKENDLGKFGMGMKTASLSHCNKLTVISKQKNKNLTAYTWDLSHIKQTGEWLLLELNQKEISDLIRVEKIEISTSGTVVLWDDLKNINREYKSYSSSKLANNFYFRIYNDLKFHLRMVFHRFLDGTAKKNSKIQIILNDEQLSPWDPFCRNETNTQNINLGKRDKLKVTGSLTPITIQGYVLPSKESFSTEEAWKDARGPSSWNDSQGYYIYRADRLIRFGGWQGTKAKDEHDKLARISIDIHPSLDSFFRITVNKSKVQFPEELYNHLKSHVNGLVLRKAKSAYKRSSEQPQITNKFRKNVSRVAELSKRLLGENRIQTQSNKSGDIEVTNPSGTWLANKIQDFLKYGSTHDFEVISGQVSGGKLWKIVCSNDDKFKVIINSRHPFYEKIYSPNNKTTTAVTDAIIFSLAFAELYNRNDQNAQLFDTFNSVCSKALERITKGELV